MPSVKKKYQPLYTSKKRYFIMTGGRGSGKTFVAQDYALRLLRQRNQCILYTRYTMSSAKTTIIPLMLEYIKKVDDPRKYKITNDKIIYKKTGSFILFSGIKANSKDQTGRLKTLPNISTWIIEEGEDFNDEKAFDDIDDSIRTNEIQNRIIWIQNPTSNEHFIYKKFFEKNHVTEKIEEAGTYVDAEGNLRNFEFQRCTHEDVEHIHTTYLDNIENLSKDKVAKWEKTKKKDPEKYNFKYIGAWRDKAEGVIFPNWEFGKFDDSLTYVFGQDYGADDPTTLVKVAVCKATKRIFVKECFVQSDIGTDKIFELNMKYSYNKDKKQCKPIIADAAAKQLIISLLGKLNDDNKGLNLYKCKKGKGSVEAGILKIKNYTIIVDPESHTIVKELNNYVWLDKKSDTPIDDFNHCIDAIRYAVDYLVN